MMGLAFLPGCIKLLQNKYRKKTILCDRVCMKHRYLNDNAYCLWNAHYQHTIPKSSCNFCRFAKQQSYNRFGHFYKMGIVCKNYCSFTLCPGTTQKKHAVSSLFCATLLGFFPPFCRIWRYQVANIRIPQNGNYHRFGKRYIKSM